MGRAADSILSSLDGGIELVGGTAAHVYLGDRIVRGWAIELVLLVALVPYLTGSIDLFARCRRRGVPLRPAWRALRIRLGVWLWVGLLVGLGALVGVFPRGSAIPPPPDSPAVTDWPVAGLLFSAASLRSAGPRPPVARVRRAADAGGGARRPRRRAARPRRRRRRDGDRQPVRSPLRDALAVRLALAAAAAATPAGLATSSTVSASSVPRSRSSRSRGSSGSGSTPRSTSSR